MEMHHIHFSELMKWTTFFNLGLPLLIGSLFLAAPAALFFYLSCSRSSKPERQPHRSDAVNSAS